MHDAAARVFGLLMRPGHELTDTLDSFLLYVWGHDGGRMEGPQAPSVSQLP